MREIDALRPLSAGELLGLWRASREEDPLERALLCNARILARACLRRDQPVYQNEWEVLDDLSGRQIERLLSKLAGGGGPLNTPSDGVNPAFDPDRFRLLREVE